MKSTVWGLIFLLLVTAVTANYDFQNYKEAELEIGIGSDLEIIREGPAYAIEYLDVMLSFYPRETLHQEVLELTTTPIAKEKNEMLNYHWNFPTQKDLAFYVTSTVKVSAEHTKVKDKIPFPIEDLPEEYHIYTQPSENIDSDNPKIIKAASEIVAGEDDTYQVAFKLAQWTERNIKYSLDTLTADVSQPASWVLDAKRGVCDELTTLYIAMLRSLGVPARFVSGVAYTNWNDLNDWGPHAWAEVYFPGYGWVPFDLTYNQFGVLDASHIVLKRSIDSNEATTDYEWKGRDVDLSTNQLDISVRPVHTVPRDDKLFTVEISPLYPSVGFGSYNAVEIKLENAKDHYLPVNLNLAKIAELKPLDGHRKQVLLKPFEEKVIYWPVQVDNNLRSDSIYTFPILLFTETGENITSAFTSQFSDPFYSFNEIQEIVEASDDEQNKVYSSEIDLSCQTEFDEYYLQDEVKIACTIKNAGNQFLEAIELCADESCEGMDLGIAQEKTVDLPLSFDEAGLKDIQIKAQNPEVTKLHRHRITILDKPNIDIDDLNHPDAVNYEEIYNISFALKKVSQSNPLEINVELDTGGVPKQWRIDQLHQTEEFIVSLRGDDLTVNENPMSIHISYFDGNGNQYEEKVDFILTLNEVTFGQRIVIFFNDLGKWVERVFA